MLNLFFRKSEDNMFEDFRLKVFMAVAETGSFTKAAKSIGISQPAVARISMHWKRKSARR